MVFFIPPIMLMILFSVIGFFLGHKRMTGSMLLLFMAVCAVFGLIFMSLLVDVGLGGFLPSYLKVFVDIFRALIGR